MHTKFEYFKVETRPSGVTLVTISRPNALNALNTDVLKEMKTLLQEISTDSSVRVLIFTGDGKSFIAGADIAEMHEKNPQQGVEFAQLGHEVSKLLELMPKPTIAAVNGYALGGGTEMAIACDFIYAGEKAVFGQPEVGLGIIPGFGATLRLSKFVGLSRAKELIFSGRRISAAEAKQMGLVLDVFPQDSLLMEVTKVAESIALQSSSAIAKAKQLLNEFSESSGLNFKLDAEAQAFGNLFGSPDQKEGMLAFVEKRKPKFLKHEAPKHSPTEKEVTS